MSYSFTITAPSKEEAKQAIAAKFDEVIASQPAHAKDKDAALATANAFIDLVKAEVPDDHVVSVNMHGSVGWNVEAPNDLTGAGVGVSVHFIAKKFLQTAM